MSNNTILLIENDEAISTQLSQIFKDLQYSCIVANNAADAVCLLQISTYFAVIIDLDTVLQEEDIDTVIKLSKPNSIVIVIGGEKYSKVICHAFQNGADDFLRKPFNTDIFKVRSISIFSRFCKIRNMHTANMKSFIDILPTIIIITDSNNNILHANTIMLQKSKCKLNDIIGQPIDKIFQNSEPNTPTLQQLTNDVLSSEKRVTRQLCNLTQNINGHNHHKTMKVSMMPIIFNNQKAVVIAMIDITVERIFINELNSKVDDLRRQHNDSEYQIKASKEIADYLRHMNDSLNREKNKLKMLFDNMTSGFLVVQRQNGNLYFQEGNTILTEIFNIDVDKYIGQKLSDDTILNNKKFHNAIINVLDTGHSTSFPISFDSSNKTYQVNMYMPEDEAVAVLINDITDEMESHRNIKELSFKLKKQNIDLDNKNYALQKAIETKNKFMSIIAHDLRNPFNAINGLSDLLAHRLSSADDKKSYEIAQLINQSAKNTYELLNNLLIWARSQQNTIEFAPEILNVHKLATETLSEIQVQADKKHVMLIDATEPNDTIYADKHMLQTIIRNLTSNAIKFTNTGGLIVISSTQNDTQTEISIEDNGVGMSQDALENLRQQTSKNSTKGTAGESGSGMGLMITKEFINKHKGTLHVESQEGKGSKFTIVFPAPTSNNENKD